MNTTMKATIENNARHFEQQPLQAFSSVNFNKEICILLNPLSTMKQ
jgi:hypothetical protein